MTNKESIICINYLHTLDSKINNYTVYWYKLKWHYNPFKQGYIGITNDIKRRDKEHRNAAKLNKKSHFYNALRKYSDDKVCLEVLHECSKKSALEFEQYYRPETNIAWNMAKSGEDTLSSVRTVPIKLYHKDNPKKVYSFNSYTEASDILKINIGRIAVAMKRKNANYGFDGWAILHDKTIDRFKTISIQQAISLRVLGTKRSSVSHFKGKKRWSDEDKKRIGNQHKGKTISEKQRKIVSEKNRQSHSKCKQIVLVHQDNLDKEYTFHSISEASRQLDIPLPRLKSKATRPLNRFGKDGWSIKSLGSE